MSLSVRVQEWTGAVVDHDGGAQFNELVDVASADYDRFPVLWGVDPCDDTAFNARQCTRLLQELQELEQQLESKAVRVTAARLSRLADLVVVTGPGQAHHRQLVFIGD